MLTMKLLIGSVLAITVSAVYALPPQTFGEVVASAGQFSNKLKESAAWKTFTGFARESNSLNSLVRIFPARAMSVVDEVIGSLRQDSRVIVLTANGALKGRFQNMKQGRQGGSYYSFKGIRYGQAPVGKRRFRSALPELAWKGVRNAMREGSACPHRNMILDNYKGNEDCLFANVYTPQLPGSDGHPRLPVMVWIHGGAFSFGSGNAFLYGPDYLVSEGVVLVTFNYRLGALGFLSVGGDAPGNAGLRDQILALKWVKENIAAFGGDPSQVTIFGQSAGAVSVHLLMLSPMASGLFTRAIAQSGSALNPWAIAERPKERAFRLGSILGINTTDTDELLDFLRRASPKKIVDASMKTITHEDVKRSVGLAFVPSVEDVWEYSEEEPFLTENPMTLLQRGAFNDVPFLTGFNTHEAMLFIRRLRKDPNLLNSIDDDFARMIPNNLNIEDRDGPDGNAITSTMREFYFDNKSVSTDSIEETIYLMSDIMFMHGIADSARLHAAHSNGTNAYLYRFAYDGALGIYKRLLGIDRPGVCHGDELGYLFHFGLLNLNLDNQSSELKVMNRMTKMWSNFAKFGQPTPQGRDDPILSVNWSPVVANAMEPLVYLDITSELETKTNPDWNRLKFWDNMYEKYNGKVL